MKVQRSLVVLLIVAFFNGGFGNQNESSFDNEVLQEYILAGSVLDDESANDALKRDAMLTYQLNLPKYL